MGFHLRDIIDLEFLLNLDEQAAGEEDLAARDRDIFRQVQSPDAGDTHLAREWLSFRKLLFFHQTSRQETLPGSLFASLMGWSARGLFAGGLVLGLVSVYGFLAYHGTRPVNVTVFISLFILLQALLSFLALWVMARQAMGPVPGRPGLFHTLIAGLFFKKLAALCRRASDLPGGGALKQLQGVGTLLGQVNRAHGGVMFWPFFILSSLFALGFSCGALGGALFRVAVTDLAFGWQSTLVTSGSTVHDLVSYLALPWSWGVPAAVPGPEQIEGSRIILKEGIAGLSTEHLTAWWPFLCMGLLTYGVVLRLAVVGLAFKAQASALSGMDVGQPRIRRLLVRMRSPNMETRTREQRISRAEHRPPPPEPEPGDEAGAGGVQDGGAGTGTGASVDRAAAGAHPALILAADQTVSELSMADVAALVTAQFGLVSGNHAAISFDLDQDREILESLAGSQDNGPVIFLQEVWQPPIRGLLHYYGRVKAGIFPDDPVWILLCGTPDHPGVPADDMNYKVWKKAVAQLAVPDLVLERILP